MRELWDEAQQSIAMLCCPNSSGGLQKRTRTARTNWSGVYGRLIMLASLVSASRTRGLSLFLATHVSRPLGGQRRLSSLPRRWQAARTDDFDQSEYFSVEDLRTRDRGIPPALDSQTEDEGYGALEYRPADFDPDEMERQERAESELLRKKTRSTPINTANAAPKAAEAAPAVTNRFEQVEEASPSMKKSFQVQNVDPELDKFLSKASSGNGVTSTLDVLEADLEKLEQEIHRANNGKEFNVNSAAQVARVLYGPQGGTTEKSVLEAKAASGNRMADMILRYRALRQTIRKLATRQENVAKGTLVKSASSVARFSSQETPSDPLILVDASSYIFRAYYSMPPIHRSDGMPTGAVMGFCNMLNKLTLNRILDGETPRLVLVFDAKGKTFRHEMYHDYKGNRPAAPVDLIPQFALVRQAAQAYGICQVEAENFEADDVIATLARQALAEGIDVNIFSGDKDLMQLVTDRDAEPSIQLIDPATMARVAYDQVVEKWGVPPSQLGDVLALAGDSADNVPGIPGIGPKIAAQLVLEYGSLENLLQRTDEIKQKSRRAKLQEYGERAKLSRVLVRLNENVPRESMTLPDGFDSVGDLRIEPLDEDRVIAFYDEMGFQDIKRRFENSLERSNRSRPKRKRPPKATVPSPDEYTDVPF